MEILTRSLIALAIVLAGMGLAALANLWSKNRSSQFLHELGPLHPSAVTLVYFTTPTCVPCKTVQRPAIERLQSKLGDMLNVIEIDATQKPELASRWGVMSVPTTFIIDPHGTVRHVNHGVIRAEKLLDQLVG